MEVCLAPEAVLGTHNCGIERVYAALPFAAPTVSLAGEQVNRATRRPILIAGTSIKRCITSAITIDTASAIKKKDNAFKTRLRQWRAESTSRFQR